MKIYSNLDHLERALQVLPRKASKNAMGVAVNFALTPVKKEMERILSRHRHTGLRSSGEFRTGSGGGVRHLADSIIKRRRRYRNPKGDVAYAIVGNIYAPYTAHAHLVEQGTGPKIDPMPGITTRSKRREWDIHAVNKSILKSKPWRGRPGRFLGKTVTHKGAKPVRFMRRAFYNKQPEMFRRFQRKLKMEITKNFIKAMRTAVKNKTLVRP